MAAVVSKTPDNDTKTTTKTTKRVTRSTIRNTLNLASVGKALADVMNKDSKEKDKDAARLTRRTTVERRRDPGPERRLSSSSLSSKESVSRRASGTGPIKGANTLEPVLEATQSKKLISSDQKTVTQIRKSSLQRAGRASVDEAGIRITPTSTIPPQSNTLTSRTATLRPRKGPTAGSALPKYRPRSVIVEGSPHETLSAIRLAARRKHSSSDDEKDSNDLETDSNSVVALHSLMDKRDKTASPKPRRLRKALESSSSGLDSSTSSPPRKSKESFVASLTSSPPRKSKESSFVASLTSTPPKKKAQKSTSPPAVSKSSLPRPSTRDSPRTSSDSPRTPSSLKNIASRYLNSRSTGRESPSPLKSSPTSNGSPVTRRSGLKKSTTSSNGSDSNQNTPTAPSTRTRTINIGDESVDDIEMMLACVSSPSDPTPSIPRINKSRFLTPPQAPETPSRYLTTSQRSMSGLSYSSLAPSSDMTSSPSRRMSPDRRPPALRSSIAAWQALADLSLEINADELKGGLIKELDLPATPVMMSPSPSMIILDSENEGRESPTPLTLPSPGGYTSISQVLLPSVTPAPGMQLRSSSFYSERRDPEISEMDSATVTLLKLQLASVENIAKERLSQIQKMEEQMHILKERRKKDERELLTHVNDLEERLREALVQRDREKDRDRAASRMAHANNEYFSVDSPDVHAECRELLDEHIRAAEEERDDAVSKAVSEIAERERAERKKLHDGYERCHILSQVASDTQHLWNNVREVADAELETVRSNRETLAVLLAGLDFFEAQIHISRCIRIPPPTAAKFHLI